MSAPGRLQGKDLLGEAVGGQPGPAAVVEDWRDGSQPPAASAWSSDKERRGGEAQVGIRGSPKSFWRRASGALDGGRRIMAFRTWVRRPDLSSF